MGLVEELEVKEKVRKIIDTLALAFKVSYEDKNKIDINRYIIEFRALALERVLAAIEILKKTTDKLPDINTLLDFCESPEVKNFLYNPEKVKKLNQTIPSLPPCPSEKYQKIWDKLVFVAHKEGVVIQEYYKLQDIKSKGICYLDGDKLIRRDHEWRKAVRLAKKDKPNDFSDFNNEADRFLEQSAVAVLAGYLNLNMED